MKIVRLRILKIIDGIVVRFEMLILIMFVS